MSNIDTDNLTEHILGFDEAEAPLLADTHQRIVALVKSGDVKRAQAAANTYLDHAQDFILAQPEKDAPKKLIGVWVKLARIWAEAGQRSKSVMALNRAINYCYRYRWPSLATALKNERAKLQNVSA